VAASGDLPPWLRRAGSRGSRRTSGRRASAGLVAAALLLVAVGGLGGFMIGRRNKTEAPPPAAPAVCPPAAACVDHPAGPAATASRARPAPAAHHFKPPRVAALGPLPESKPLDDETRTEALRAFARERAAELRDCLPEPDRGPPVKLGAAFEIRAGGAVDFVQILGADGSSRDVRRCYASRLKRWRFPEDLLRGEEKLLVNFVL